MSLPDQGLMGSNSANTEGCSPYRSHCNPERCVGALSSAIPEPQEHCPGQWHRWVLGLFRNLWKAAFIGLALRCPILDKLHHPGGPASWKPVHGRAHFWGRGISGLAHQSWIGDCLVAVADLAGVNYLLSRVEVLMNSRHSASGSESKDPRFWR